MAPVPCLNLAAWESELSDDPDRDFLLDGIRHGFFIVDKGAQVLPMQADNHPSATPCNANYEAVKHQNYKMVITYFVTTLLAWCCSKKDGGITLIHDCRRPFGKSLNDYASIGMSHKFQTIDNATSSVQAGYYMSKVDLKSAYRYVSINTESQQFTGLKFWLDDRFVYVRDTKLPFGSKLATGIFHRLTQTVKRMMEKRGFTALAFI